MISLISILPMCFERCDLEGMTSKAFTQVLKLGTVYACARETLNHMFPESENPASSFTVLKVDVLAAFEIVDLSMNTFKYFKVLSCLKSLIGNDLVSA